MAGRRHPKGEKTIKLLWEGERGEKRGKVYSKKKKKAIKQHSGWERKGVVGGEGEWKGGVGGGAVLLLFHSENMSLMTSTP